MAHPSGEDTIALIREAGELGVPTLFHCDEPLTTPLAIEPAAAARPDSMVILGHMGGYFHADEAIEAAERQPNMLPHYDNPDQQTESHHAQRRADCVREHHYYAHGGRDLSSTVECQWRVLRGQQFENVHFGPMGYSYYHTAYLA